MVKIITGDICSGKTSTMVRIYEKELEGNGFISDKIFDHSGVIGYNIKELSTGISRPFFRKKTKNRPSGFDGEFTSFYVNTKLLSEINNRLIEMADKNVSPIYIDEIGQYEINGGGFDKAFRYLLGKKANVIITVRKKYLQEVIRHYAITDYEIKDCESR